MPIRHPKKSDDSLRRATKLLSHDASRALAELTEHLKSTPFDAKAYNLLRQAKQSLGRQNGGLGGVSSLTVTASDRQLRQASEALRNDDLPTAELLLRVRLLDQPADVQSLRMMAELATRLGLVQDAEDLLRYATNLEPGFTAAKLDLAKRVHLRNQNNEALAIIDEVLQRDPGSVQAKYMKAVVLGHSGRFEETLAIYEDLIQRSPNRARLWTSYGRALKTIGRSAEGIKAFRRATDLDAALGEAWWSLSDLKTVRFSEADISRMDDALRRDDLLDNDRYYLEFALGKAFEDSGEFRQSFAHYSTANKLRREQLDYEPNRITDYVTTAIQLLNQTFFDARSGCGFPSRDPIFILGMTRAGSTLIEQILSSHPEIEGTMELPQVLGIAGDLAEDVEYRVTALATLDQGRFAELGERYVRETRIYRKTDRPFFTDKMPNNWLYVPLIYLMLPNARIIDARRHPLACCLSNFKQNYARGQAFSYDLASLGRFYSDYVRMMKHIDEVLPGKVHRVFHESLVENTRHEVEKLLDYLQLPFHENCLRFHENSRAVRTASAEQVRRPINRIGVDQWRSFEPWLGPLKTALGPVLDMYPSVPPFED